MYENHFIIRNLVKKIAIKTLTYKYLLIIPL